MTWKSIGIDVDELNKKALQEFEECKKKVDNGELCITMLIQGPEDLKVVIKSDFERNLMVFKDRLPREPFPVLEVYPNKWDKVEVYECPSKYIPDGWEYLLIPCIKSE